MLRICVESDDDRVEINAVKELTLTQDGSAIIKPILDAEPTNPSTTVSKYDNSAGRQYIAVETTLLTEFFFNDPNPGPITIKGVARMQFPEKRRLRQLQTEPTLAGESEFDFTIPYDPEPVNDPAPTVMPDLTFVMFLAVVALI
jgi:hypothetical protein